MSRDQRVACCTRSICFNLKTRQHSEVRVGDAKQTNKIQFGDTICSRVRVVPRTPPATSLALCSDRRMSGMPAQYVVQRLAFRHLMCRQTCTGPAIIKQARAVPKGQSGRLQCHNHPLRRQLSPFATHLKTASVLLIGSCR